jgi:hypothetical protein
LAATLQKFWIKKKRINTKKERRDAKKQIKKLCTHK